MPYIIALVILIGGIFGAANYMTLGQLNALSFSKPSFGVSLTTINSATKISDLATILPANFNALNAGKIENSTTSLPLLTTTLNLTSVGTIGTGLWRGTAIEVGYGGTGTTSPTSNLVILGNGSSGFKVVSGFGTTGQFLTSNGNASAPTWQTSAVDTGIAYTWTGKHIFSGTGNIIGSSTQYTINAGTINASSTLTIAGITVDGGGQQLGETVLGSNATSITVAAFPARQDLKIEFAMASTTGAGGATFMTFNSDTGSNYGYRYYTNNGAANTAANGTKILPIATSSPSYVSFNIMNKLNVNKLVTWMAALGNLSMIPDVMFGAGTWNNKASQITTVTFTLDGGDDYVAGSRVTVYGKKD